MGAIAEPYVHMGTHTHTRAQSYINFVLSLRLLLLGVKLFSLSLSLSIFLSLPFVCVSVCLSVYLSIYPIMHLPVHRPISLLCPGT